MWGEADGCGAEIVARVRQAPTHPNAVSIADANMSRISANHVVGREWDLGTFRW